MSKYKFKGFQGIYGFLAFDENDRSAGFDEVSSYIENLEAENQKLHKTFAKIRGMCGNADPVKACQNILEEIRLQQTGDK